MIAKTFSTFFCTAIKKFASFLANSGWAHPILNLHKPSEELPVSQRIHLNPQNHLLYSTVPFSNKFSDLACYSQPKKTTQFWSFEPLHLRLFFQIQHSKQVLRAVGSWSFTQQGHWPMWASAIQVKTSMIALYCPFIQIGTRKSPGKYG